jgi:hypothetical protein
MVRFEHTVTAISKETMLDFFFHLETSLMPYASHQSLACSIIKVQSSWCLGANVRLPSHHRDKSNDSVRQHHGRLWRRNKRFEA